MLWRAEPPLPPPPGYLSVLLGMMSGAEPPVPPPAPGYLSTMEGWSVSYVSFIERLFDTYLSLAPGYVSVAFMLDLMSEQQELMALLTGALLVLTVLFLKRSGAASAPEPRLRLDDDVRPAPLLECIRARRSVFPRSYVARTVPPATMSRLLEAAMWAPYHGPVPPWRFVVLGRKAMVDMQRLTLDYYDAHWRVAGWADGKHGTASEYLKWRMMTEDEIAGRWGPVSYMVAIVMRRQAGSKRLPEWEEAAATACAVQNMCLQASAHAGLACYWSSWHDAARDSEAMHAFLGMGDGDRCLGFLIVAACEPALKDSRMRQPETHLSVEWRD